jgi:hypothetical protein
MDELVRTDARAAWHLVQVMVAYAPDYGALISVAAGPVEDLRNPAIIPLMVAEAQVNARFRVCLGAANAMPEELERLALKHGEHQPLPPANAVDATADEIRVMTAWFHNHDTFWIAHMLKEWNKASPNDALQVLRVLLKLCDESPQVREAVLSEAVEGFLRHNPTEYREQVEWLARDHEALREYLVKRFGDSL